MQISLPGEPGPKVVPVAPHPPGSRSQNRRRRRRKPKPSGTLEAPQESANPAPQESAIPAPQESAIPDATAKPRKRRVRTKRKKSQAEAIVADTTTTNETQVPNEVHAVSNAEDSPVTNASNYLQSPEKNPLTDPRHISMENTKLANSMKPAAENNNQSVKYPLGSASNNSIPKSAPVKNEVLQNAGKSRDAIKAEQEAKKLAKQQVKLKIIASVEVAVDKQLAPDGSIENNKQKSKMANVTAIHKDISHLGVSENNSIAEESRDEILAERQAKKSAKLAAKNKDKNDSGSNRKLSTDEVDKSIINKLSTNLEHLHLNDAGVKKEKQTTKAERRAIQEAQRHAKVKLLADNQKCLKPTSTFCIEPVPSSKTLSPKTTAARVEKCSDLRARHQQEYKVKLFNHLNGTIIEHNLFINSTTIHPAIVRLGEQYLKRTIVGSNARCIAFLNAMKMVIQDYVTPPKTEFARGVETSIKNCVEHLQECRPLAVSIINAHKYIKFILTQLQTNLTDSKLKECLSQLLDNYIRDQIDKAAEAISSSVQEKISNGDVILTFGCSSLINHILEEAHRRNVDFRVILVDSRPFLEGQELLRRLVSKGISCSCVLINAIGFIMPEVTRVLLGAHALLANGYVMARTGTAQVALVARSFNVPVLVCCETHKFSERVQTDAIVFNELGKPDDLVKQLDGKDNRLANWQSFQKLYPLNLIYDITPPELVTAVVTEVAILPCTSVPVILRIKPTDLLY